jgi:hypothetical protein
LLRERGAVHGMAMSTQLTKPRVVDDFASVPPRSAPRPGAGLQFPTNAPVLSG